MENFDIVTDVRHGTRKTSMYTDVIWLGARTHTLFCMLTSPEKDCTSEREQELIRT